MKKQNIFLESFKKIPFVKKNENRFEGKVKQKDISKNIKQKDYKIYHVLFIKGAKTKIHLHKTSQTLIATKGKGIVVTFKEIKKVGNGCIVQRTGKVNLEKGEMVIIPKEIIHLHGADGNNDFSHIAINGMEDPNTIWYESDLHIKEMLSN